MVHCKEWPSQRNESCRLVCDWSRVWICVRKLSSGAWNYLRFSFQFLECNGILDRILWGRGNGLWNDHVALACAGGRANSENRPYSHFIYSALRSVRSMGTVVRHGPV